MNDRKARHTEHLPQGRCRGGDPGGGPARGGADWTRPTDPKRVALPPLPGERTIKHKATPAKAKHAWAESQLREAMRAAATDETTPA